MAKNEYGIFTTQYHGHEVNYYVSSTQAYYSTEALREKQTYGEFQKHFETYQQICDALDRFELAQRKNFTNTVGYRLKGVGGFYRHAKDYTVEEVTITSIPDEYSLWIKNSEGERQKVAASTVYSDRAEAEHFQQRMAAMIIAFEEKKERMQKELDRFVWRPVEK